MKELGFKVSQPDHDVITAAGVELFAACSHKLVPAFFWHVAVTSFAVQAWVYQDYDVRVFARLAALVHGQLGLPIIEPSNKFQVPEERRGINDQRLGPANRQIAGRITGLG